MTDLFAEAMITFRDLLDAARASGDPEPTAMTLATRGEQDRLAARTVLLKAHDDRGFVFYTNTRSRKGEDLAAHPSAALLFHWKHLRHGVQVRIEGAVQPVTDDEADRYFASRPRMSQIGAWASDQSRTLDRREHQRRHGAASRIAVGCGAGACATDGDAGQASLPALCRSGLGARLAASISRRGKIKSR